MPVLDLSQLPMPIDPRRYVTEDDEVLCFRHAQALGITQMKRASELRRTSRWADPSHRFFCRDCDRRGLPVRNSHLGRR